jgi:hypothetical protein
MNDMIGAEKVLSMIPGKSSELDKFIEATCLRAGITPDDVFRELGRLLKAECWSVGVNEEGNKVKEFYADNKIRLAAASKILDLWGIIGKGEVATTVVNNTTIVDTEIAKKLIDTIKEHSEIGRRVPNNFGVIEPIEEAETV